LNVRKFFNPLFLLVSERKEVVEREIVHKDLSFFEPKIICLKQMNAEVENGKR
jgi:hypothetical protein